MAQAIEAYAPRFIARLHSKYLHNTHILNTKWALALEKTNPLFAKCNNILHVAPIVKWALSVVPITLAFTGAVPPEKIDMKQSAALGTTGVVWTFYAILLRKQNAGMLALGSVNATMAIVNFTNFIRGYLYQRNQKEAEQPAK
eukprot:Phypoly_transcript_14467.p1 GENE.Phypoly_transcript_14467~~Phypoly_transcript_14467.p1  ORF type:complete len:143 (-),score=19.91 Phypoly_transcript_14467:98-526(-)